MATTSQHRALVSRDLAKTPESRQTLRANGNAAYERGWSAKRILDSEKRPVLSGNNWGEKAELRNTFRNTLIALQFGMEGKFSRENTFGTIKIISNLASHLEIVDLWNAVTSLWERVRDDNNSMEARVDALEMLPSIHGIIVTREETELAIIAKETGLPRVSRSAIVLEENRDRSNIEGTLVNELIAIVEAGMDPEASEPTKELARAANLALMEIESPLISETFSEGAMI